MFSIILLAVGCLTFSRACVSNGGTSNGSVGLEIMVMVGGCVPREGSRVLVVFGLRKGRTWAHVTGVNRDGSVTVVTDRLGRFGQQVATVPGDAVVAVES